MHGVVEPLLAAIYPWVVALLLLAAAAFAYVRWGRRLHTGSAPPVIDESDLARIMAAGLAGALLLVWGVLALLGGEPRIGGWERLLLHGLLGVGLASFLLTAASARWGRLPGRLATGLGRTALLLQIQPAQVLLLLFALCFSLLGSVAAGDLALARYPWISVLSWAAALLLAAAGGGRRAAGDGGRPQRMELLFLLLLFLSALVLRGTAIEQLPANFSGDEGSTGLVAVLFTRGEFTNLFSVGWFSFPSFYFGVQSIGVQLWGQTVAAVRLPSVIAGAYAVLAVYWLGRQMFGRLTASFAAVYLMASHYHIHISRIALNNVWDSLFAAVALAGLWDGWQHNRRASFLLSGLALGLGQYFYASIRILPILFLIWAGAAFLVRREQFRQRFAGLTLAAFMALVTVLPLALYFQDHMNEFNAPLQRVTIFNGWLDAEQTRTGQSAAAVITTQAGKGIAGFVYEPLRLLYNPGAPLLLPGAAALFLMGVTWLLLRFDLRALLLFLPLLAVVLSNTLSQDPPSSQRYILAMPTVALLLGLPLGQMTARLQRMWPQRARWVLGAAVLFMLLVVANDVRYYFFDVYDSYVMGGLNTETATEVAHYLQAQPDPAQDVYFFGFPRMGYRSLSTIPYLAPQMRGQDVVEPLTAVPDWELNGPTLFIFLPEREAEQMLVAAAHPGGVYRQHYSDRGVHLFSTYAVP